jgi:hypothetical protein
MRKMCASCTKWFEESDLYQYSDKDYCTKCFPIILPWETSRTNMEVYYVDLQRGELFIRLYFRKFQKLKRKQREKYTYDHIKNIDHDYDKGYFKVQFDNGEWWCLFPLTDILKELNELFGDIEHYKTTQGNWFFTFKSYSGQDKSKETPNEVLSVMKNDYSLWYRDKCDNHFRFHLYLFEINEWDRDHYTYGSYLKNLPELPKEVVE